MPVNSGCLGSRPPSKDAKEIAAHVVPNAFEVFHPSASAH